MGSLAPFNQPLGKGADTWRVSSLIWRLSHSYLVNEVGFLLIEGCAVGVEHVVEPDLWNWVSWL